MLMARVRASFSWLGLGVPCSWPLLDVRKGEDLFSAPSMLIASPSGTGCPLIAMIEGQRTDVRIEDRVTIVRNNHTRDVGVYGQAWGK